LFSNTKREKKRALHAAAATTATAAAAFGGLAPFWLARWPLSYPISHEGFTLRHPEVKAESKLWYTRETFL